VIARSKASAASAPTVAEKAPRVDGADEITVDAGIGAGVVMVMSGSPMIRRIILYAVTPLSLAICTSVRSNRNIRRQRWTSPPSLNYKLLYSQYISKADAVRITKLNVHMFHDESWKPIYFGVKRSKMKVTSVGMGLPPHHTLHLSFLLSHRRVAFGL